MVRKKECKIDIFDDKEEGVRNRYFLTMNNKVLQFICSTFLLHTANANLICACFLR